MNEDGEIRLLVLDRAIISGENKERNVDANGIVSIDVNDLQCETGVIYYTISNIYPASSEKNTSRGIAAAEPENHY